MSDAPATPPHDWVAEALCDNWGVVSRYIPGGEGPDECVVEAYGCGVYGCVFPSVSSPEIVIKITSDETEVDFVRLYLSGSSFRHPGVVRYEEIIRLRQRPVGTKACLLVREAADRIGDMGHHELLQDYWRVASALTDLFDADGNRSRRASAILLSKEEPIIMAAVGVVEGRMGNRAVERAAREITPLGVGDWRVLRSALLLAACRYSACLMSRDRDLQLVGDAAQYYMDLGVLLSDLKEDNIGVVRRSGVKRVRGSGALGRGLFWVITDPGVTSIFGPPADMRL